ncbi:MAG: SUF system NifU family Fe-S cluster assembly protein [Euryarchaeota archaeon]|nr:SUF system NifU family Fe-S cluster assembly protein [Euryarchaeota archaeon]
MTGIEMYREHILEHYKSPQNYGTLDTPDIQYREDNPLCGDDIEIHIRLEDDRIADIRFHGQGCAISQASASLLTDAVKGKSLDEIKAMDNETVMKLLGIPISPVRLKCALLSLVVIQGGIKVHETGGRP